MTPVNHRFASDPLWRRIKGLMLGRVIIITFLWMALGGVELTGDPTPARLPLTYIILITYSLTILYALWLRRRPNLERLYLSQVGVDLLLETAIVHSTGGHDSGFVFLYILSIISAGMALPGRSICAIAAGASSLYSLLVFLDFDGIVRPLPFPLTLQTEVAVNAPYVVYSTLLTMTAFWAVALLSRYLAESLRQTGRVLQEQAAHLVGLQAFHENVVRSMSSGLLITDMAGQVVSANDAAARILQLAEGQRQGWCAQKVFSFIDIADVLARVEELDGGLNRAEGPYERNDGRKIILGVSYAPLRDEHGTVHGLIFNCQDITAIRAMEAEVKRAEQLAAVGRLAAAMAHEIRNPLASISGSMQLLRAELVRDEGSRRLMDIVAHEVERLNTTITDFLAYARPRPLECTEVDLHKLIAGALELLRHGLPEGSAVTIHTAYEPAVPPVTADPQELRQVIWNLCLNAVEAMQYRGTLTVRTALPAPLPPSSRAPVAQEVCIEVIDTGPGMSAEVQAKMFEPFFSTKEGGTGLGLATVDRIVYNHRGRLEVDSQPGQGTTMRVYLPLRLTTSDIAGVHGGS
jgi:two-component system sensor histidine kinase PilS (NtrC family)